MPLVELHSYVPICDICGAVGSTWNNLRDSEKEQAIPASWVKRYRHEWMENGPWEEPDTVTEILYCDTCRDQLEPLENDSRA